MNLFEVLGIKLPIINPNECKIHLAVFNGDKNSLNVFLSGDFKTWQSWQTKKNFERKYIVSLITVTWQQ